MSGQKITDHVCKYYNIGFCKYLNRCKFKHPKTNCPKETCHDRSCENRHPKPCRYKDQCRGQTSCLYQHKSHTNETLAIERLKSEIKKLEDSINDKINLVVKVHVKEIDDLVEKLTKAEAENKVLNDLIKSSECSESDSSWTDIEDEELSSCEDCAAKFETKTSLKTHKKMFPAFCYKCELWLNDGKQLKDTMGLEQILIM